LQQVLDLEEVAGDLEVVVAVHEVRWFLSEGTSEGTKRGKDRDRAAGRLGLQLERGTAQQLEQQQLQRARAAPWDPAVRVEVGAKFASMPTRQSVHTSTVNSTPGKWDAFHLIRFIYEVKGLFTARPGHMAHNRAHRPPVERDRTSGRPSPYRLVCGVGGPPGPRLRVKVYADLNTFCMALVPQSE